MVLGVGKWKCNVLSVLILKHIGVCWAKLSIYFLTVSLIETNNGMQLDMSGIGLTQVSLCLHS